MRAFFVFLSLMVSLRAHATYDSGCILLLSEHHSTALLEWRDSWDEALMKIVGRAVSNIEYEAIMDFSSGLPLEALANTGEKMPFSKPGESFEKIKDFLSAREIVEVVYFPEALAKLGWLYKEACILLRRDECEAYDHYQGLDPASGPRPLFRLEEQTLKWSTFHLIPLPAMADVYRGLGISPMDVISINTRGRKDRLKTAREMIESVFSPKEATILSEMLVGPIVSNGFDNILRRYRGEAAH